MRAHGIAGQFNILRGSLASMWRVLDGIATSVYNVFYRLTNRVFDGGRLLGDVLEDVSGNNLDATLYTGRAVTLDGVNDYLSITGLTTTGYIRVSGMARSSTDGSVPVSVSDGAFSIVTISADGNWHSFSVTVESTSSSVVYVGLNNVTIPNDYFSGDLADIQIEDKVDVIPEVESIIGKYYLNEYDDPTANGLNGMTFYDRSGNGNHGTFVGCAAVTALDEIAQTATQNWNNEYPYLYTSDFSAGLDSFSAVGGTATGNIDDIGPTGDKRDDNLRFVSNATTGAHRVARSVSATALSRVILDVFVPSGNTSIDGIEVRYSTNIVLQETSIATDQWVTIDSGGYFDTTGITFMPINALNGTSNSFAGTSGDTFYVRNVRILDGTSPLLVPEDESNLGFDVLGTAIACPRESNNELNLGGADYAVIPYNAAMDNITTAGTWSWVLNACSLNTAEQDFISRYDSGGFKLWNIQTTAMNPDRIAIQIGDAAGAFLESVGLDPFLTTGRHHYAITMELDTTLKFKFYRDGTLLNTVSAVTATTLYTLGTNGIGIGTSETAGTPTDFAFAGIDEVKVYSATLSADEVKQLYLDAI